MKTLLQIVQQVCRSIAVPVPATVVGNSEKTVQQLLGLMEELLVDLEMRQWWEAAVREATFTSLADEDQGFLSDIADEGFIQFLPDTFFNRTTNLYVSTGFRPDEWQAIKAGPGVAGPYYQARVRNGKLLLSPTPPAGETFAFEYHSRFFIEATPYNPLDSTPATYVGTWGADSQRLLGPPGLGPAWLKFAWKREKGLDYAEDQITYEGLLAHTLLRDNGPRPINMAGCDGRPRSGVIVPIGSWPT